MIPTPFKKAPRLAACAAALALLASSAAHAVSTSATVPVALSVVSPTCSVANDNASIILPTVATVTQQYSQYVAANTINNIGQGGGQTSSALNQTATISCNLANVAILSFGVRPSASATLQGATALQYMVDSATTPLRAFGGYLTVYPEQVSVNGVAAAMAYLSGGQVAANTTAFATGALASGTSTAAVVWRPVLLNNIDTSTVGNPTGGAFRGSFDIVVNY